MFENTSAAFGHFVSEIRRRHVARFAFGYAAAGFVVLQLAEIVFPAFGIGEWGLRVLVIAVALGFLPAVMVAWVFDVTPDGIVRTADDPSGQSLLPRVALVVVTVSVVGGLSVWLASRGDFDATASRSGTSAPVELAAFDPSAPIRSLAVLPLDDFSPEGDNEFFTASMHEELIAKLSQLDGLRVVSRTSVGRYRDSDLTAPQIGRELGVDALIEGSVVRSDARVRITLQLIHAPSDSHIRTLQYERDLDDILALQSEVAHDVAHEIQGQLSPAEEELLARTANTIDLPADAQSAYLKGKMEYDRGTPDGYRAALDYFEDAVDAAPDFAPAVAGMAGARFLLGLEAPQSATAEITRAHQDAVRAVGLDSGSVEAREVLSFIERSIPRLAELDVALAPRVPVTPDTRVRVVTVPGFDSIAIDASAFDTAWVWAVTGLGQRIEEQVRRRTLTDPRAGVNPDLVAARQLMTTGRFDEAAGILGGVTQRQPAEAAAWEMLFRAQASAADSNGLVTSALAWREAGAPGGAAGSADALAEGVASEGLRAYWRWSLERLLSERSGGGDVSWVEVATAHAALGEQAAAFDALTQALERSERGLLGLHADPVWDDLRRDPRFRDLNRQLRTFRFSPAVRGRPGGRGPGGPG